ncbi:MAG: hypothetical protein CMJ78_02345, partial [Planctomycetaceae bacterium]|nr:hypothetical protein [Planctomycetaceae bacterium]
MKYLMIFLFSGFFCAAASASAAEDFEFFETRIRPVLVKHCYKCHSSAAAQIKGELVLDFRGGTRKGGESGPAVVPGKPDESLLLAAMKFNSFEMPPSGKLPARIIADFEKWIRSGAADPRDKPPSAETAEATWKAQLAVRRHWWSLQAPKDVTPPKIDSEAWSKEPVDRFIFDALQEADLQPAKAANAETLLRRLSFVLTGLPPTPEKVVQFKKAYAKEPESAYAALVDKLLSSPHFGERIARHWMDVVRYTDTYGYEWDNPAKGSWEYRDYLIRAFNDDISLDQLIREQIAGDLLPEPRLNAKAGVNESIIGPMFYHMGEHRHGSSLNFNGIHQEMVNNKIDAFSKAFLAMTVACARCHDHKLDAVSQADYYALAGVIMSPRWTSRVIDLPGKYDLQIEKLKELRAAIQHKLADRWKADSGLATSLKKWAAANEESLKKSKPEEIGHLLHQIAQASDADVSKVWTELATKWKTTRAARQKSNTGKFTTVASFEKPGFPERWVWEGDGIKHGYAPHSSALVSLDGDSLVAELLPRGYHTHLLSSKLPGAVRLPPLKTIDGTFISLKMRGAEWSGYLKIPQNALQTEPPRFFNPKLKTPEWISVGDSDHRNGVTRIWTDFMTSAMNPHFPPRTGAAVAAGERLPAKDNGFNKRSYFSMTEVVAHDKTGVPADTLDEFADLYGAGEGGPDNIDAAWQRIGAWFESSINRHANGQGNESDAQLINWLLEQKLLANDANAVADVGELIKQYRQVESEIDFARTANSMDERDFPTVDYALNIRGDVYNEGPKIERRFLEVFDGKQNVHESKGSGRLELAEYLSSPNNPQTARVFVNRVWYWIFGRGIVATPSDFGKLGAQPSHPELLDWLARTFVSEGWSTKKLIRRLVLSKSFRQSALTTQKALDVDPNNTLLHHYAMRRLEAEAIRDNMLAVSGRFDPKLYGHPINPPRYSQDASKRLFSGPVDSHGRRSIYLQMSIMDPPKFLVCFNLPDLK